MHPEFEQGVEKKEKSSKALLTSYLGYFTIAFVIVGVFLVSLGSLLDTTFVTAIGTVVTSSAIIGILFKVKEHERHLPLVERIIVDPEFIKTLSKVLSEEKLKLLIIDLIVALKRSAPSPDIYEAFERYLIDELVGVVTRNRSYNIELRYDDSYGPGILYAKVRYSCTFINESPQERPLFADDVVLRGHTTTPKALEESKIPPDLLKLWSLKEFYIDGKLEKPEVKVDWMDPADKIRGLKREVKFKRTIQPRSPVHLEYTEEFLVDEADYISREIITLCEGVAINVHHPTNLGVVINWFGKAKNPHFNLHRPEESLGEYSQRVDGIFFPGNGFLVWWRPIKSMSEKIRHITKSS